jgi:hypothetical protein
MSHPSQFGPSNQPSGGGGSSVLTILLIVGIILLLICGGLCAGCYVVAQRTGAAIGQGLEQAPLIFVHLQAAAAVSSNPEAIEKLGEPIEPQSYTRSATGPLQPAGETLQFDVKGPKGSGIVSVVATKNGESWEPSKITLTLQDGTVIDIPPSDSNMGDSSFPVPQEEFGSDVPSPDLTPVEPLSETP